MRISSNSKVAAYITAAIAAFALGAAVSTIASASQTPQSTETEWEPTEPQLENIVLENGKTAGHWYWGSPRSQWPDYVIVDLADGKEVM